MLETIIFIAILLWVLGFLGNGGYRTFGGGYGYPSIGAVIIVVLVLVATHVI